MGLHSRDLKIKHISCCSHRFLRGVVEIVLDPMFSRLIVEEIVCCSRPASTSPPPPGRRAGRGAAAAPYRVSALLTHTHHLVPPSSPPSGAQANPFDAETDQASEGKHYFCSFFAPRFELHGPTESPQNRNQTIKTAKRIKESNTTSIPLIPSHSKMESKYSVNAPCPTPSELHLSVSRSPTPKLCAPPQSWSCPLVTRSSDSCCRIFDLK